MKRRRFFRGSCMCGIHAVGYRIADDCPRHGKPAPLPDPIGKLDGYAVESCIRRYLDSETMEVSEFEADIEQRLEHVIYPFGMSSVRRVPVYCIGSNEPAGFIDVPDTGSPETR